MLIIVDSVSFLMKVKYLKVEREKDGVSYVGIEMS
jgi:hypothetical protein